MKNITLHKSNEIVRGGDGLSVHAKRLLNSIYYLIQTNVNKGNTKAIENATYIPLEFPYLRKMMGLEKVESYIKEIEDAFTELQEPIQLNNFKNPRDGKLYNWYSISIISEASWSIDNNKKVAYIALAPLVKWLMINTNNGNFTKLDLIPTINKLRTKYSIKLYEYLKSFGAYRYLDISQKRLPLNGRFTKSSYLFNGKPAIMISLMISSAN
jgi:plasmid replication initiation protein